MQETQWKFYTDSKDAWEAMLAECENATQTIDLEQFIFINDEVGKRFLDVCSQKARQGLKVRILCDAAGSFSFLVSPKVEQLKKDGVQVVFFNTFIPLTLHNHSLWFFRDHRKLLIVDSKIGFTGGICLSEEMKDWRDTHVRIGGNVVHEMHHSFESMWRRAHKKRRRAPLQLETNENTFNYVTNIPRPKKRYLYYKLIDAIRKAKQYIYLTTPYFVPNNKFLTALKKASQRGVDVRLIIPEYSDHKIVDIGSRTFFQNTLRSGISIYLYKSKMIHSKTAIIDDEWSTVGSLNLDNVSFLYNFEANLVSKDRAFANELKSHFLSDLNNSSLLTLETWQKRPYLQQLLEILVYPIRSFL